MTLALPEDAVAARAERTIAQGVNRAFATLRAALSRSYWRRAVRTNTVHAALTGPVWDRVEAALLAELQGTYRAALRAVAESFAATLPRVAKADPVPPDPLSPETPPPPEDLLSHLFGRFDLTNPRAVEFIDAFAADRVLDLTDTTRAAVRLVLRRLFTEPLTVAQAAQLLFDVVGLSPRYGLAVANFRLRLLAESRAPEQVERLVTTYAERLRRSRARTIARTEAIRASVDGQQLLWREARAVGLLDAARTKRAWIVTPDERLCPRCAPIPAAGPVGLDEPFTDGAGMPVAGPPDHPNCRCAVRLVFQRPDGTFPTTAAAPAYGGASGPPRRARTPRVPRQPAA